MNLTRNNLNKLPFSRLLIPPTIEEKDEDDIEKILSFELSRRYPLLDNSSSCTTYVSVQEVLNDLTTPRKDHQTRKSISTSSGFPKENVCETLYKKEVMPFKKETKLNFPMEMHDVKESNSMENNIRHLNRTNNLSARMMIKTSQERNEHVKLFVPIERIQKFKSSDYAKKNNNSNLSSILNNFSSELNRLIKSKSEDILSRNIVPKSEHPSLREQTFLTEPKPSKKIIRKPQTINSK